VGEFDPAWLDSAWFVVAATDAVAVNRAVAEAAAERRLFANVVDDAELSSAQLPAVVRRGALQIAISSAGAAPMLARALREKLETELDESLGPLTELLAAWRGRIKRRLPDLAARRGFFSRILTGTVPAALRAGEPARRTPRPRHRTGRRRSHGHEVASPWSVPARAMLACSPCVRFAC
jgi:uroporphyrin-III C-methyltransferase/precorrin-2 dehydrogenase/sirohydrochlorin ferrochelatase